MDLKTFIENANINWEDASVQPDGGPLGYDCPFDLTPEEFITFAKADVFNADLRGLVNGLSNAKRAIDCEVDSFIVCLGLDPQNLSKQLGQVGLAELNGNGTIKNELPLKFRFLSTLSVATPEIINRKRKLRNVLEHEYRRCRRREVCDAIDIAELFVQACQGRLRSAWQIISIGSGSTTFRQVEEPEICITLSFESNPSGHFNVRMHDHRERLLPDGSKSKHVSLNPGDKGFVSALKLLWRADINRDLTAELAEFLTAVGVNFPRKRLNASGV